MEQVSKLYGLFGAKNLINYSSFWYHYQGTC